MSQPAGFPPGPDVETQLLLTRFAERVSELELWLAMFIIKHGERHTNGFKFVIDQDQAMAWRRIMTRPDMHVIVTVDRHNGKNRFVLDAI